jgi:hypothetical protein
MFGLYLVLMVIILGEALFVFIVGVAHKYTMFLSNGSDCSAVFLLQSQDSGSAGHGE